MHIISLKKFREFWAVHPEARDALRAWHGTVEDQTWNRFADVRTTYGSVDLCGKCHIFNVGGNKYRIIAAIHYNRHKVYIRHVLTHVEYTRGKWREEC